MQNRTEIFNKGDLLFEEGQQASTVMIIVSGTVVLQRRIGGEEKVIARLGAGEILGEGAVFNRHSHTVTAKAEEEVEILPMDTVQAQEMFNAAPQFIRKMVASMSARLRGAYNFPDEKEGGHHAHLLSTWGGDGVELPYAIHLEAGTDAVEGQLPDPITVEILPYTISNAHGEKRARHNHNSLKLSLPGCTDFATPHFELIYRQERICVRDLGSRAGTIVNGHKISRFDRSAVEPLSAGPNRVVAGGADGPVSFVITLAK